MARLSTMHSVTPEQNGELATLICAKLRPFPYELLEDGAIRIELQRIGWHVDIDRWGHWIKIRSTPVETPAFMSR